MWNTKECNSKEVPLYITLATLQQLTSGEKSKSSQQTLVHLLRQNLIMTSDKEWRKNPSTNHFCSFSRKAFTWRYATMRKIRCYLWTIWKLHLPPICKHHIHVICITVLASTISLKYNTNFSELEQKKLATKINTTLLITWWFEQLL